MHAGTAPARWIAGPRTDRWVFFGLPLLLLPLAALLVLQPAWLVPLFWAWLLCIDGPHLLATGLRSWLDPAQAQAAAWRSRAAWPWLVPLAAWGLAQAWPQARSMELLLAAGALYSWYHLTRQHEGVLAIYHAQTRSAAMPAGPAPERLPLRAWLWSAFVLAAAATPAQRAAWLAEAAPAQVPVLAMALDAVAALAGAALGLSLASYLRQGLRRRRAGASLRAWWFGLLPVGAVSSVALLALGWREPLYAGAHTREDSLLAVTLLTGLLHGTQYLAIVLAANRRRHAAGGPGLVPWLARRPGWTLLLCAGIGLTAYAALNLARGTLPGPQPWGLDTPAAQGAMALYWGLFFHHYEVDSKIWRVGGDAALRRELNIA